MFSNSSLSLAQIWIHWFFFLIETLFHSKAPSPSNWVENSEEGGSPSSPATQQKRVVIPKAPPSDDKQNFELLFLKTQMRINWEQKTTLVFKRLQVWILPQTHIIRTQDILVPVAQASIPLPQDHISSLLLLLEALPTRSCGTQCHVGRPYLP